MRHFIYAAENFPENFSKNRQRCYPYIFQSFQFFANRIIQHIGHGLRLYLVWQIFVDRMFVHHNSIILHLI